MEQDTWSIVISQIVYHSVALREVLTACGMLLLSAHRDIPQPEYDREMALVLSQATKAIQELAVHHRPLIEVVLTAYTLWCLDIMSCRFESATVHGLSALKIARQCHKTLVSDELASTFVQHMIFNLSKPDTVQPSHSAKAPPSVRRVEAVTNLELEYDRITASVQRVITSNVPDKHDILTILEDSRQEIQWILSRYNTLELYVEWVLKKQAQDATPHQKLPALADKPGILQSLVKNIDEFITTTDEISMPIPAPVDLWRKVSAQETLMYIVMVAGTDLSLRCITLDFMEVSRQIRWPGKWHVRALGCLDWESNT